MNQKQLGVIVITKKRYIVGVVTDGDLRRELNKKSSRKSLINFITKNPQVVNENMPATKALGIMNEKKITSIKNNNCKERKTKPKTCKKKLKKSPKSMFSTVFQVV